MQNSLLLIVLLALVGCVNKPEPCTIEMCLESYGDSICPNPNFQINLPKETPPPIPNTHETIEVFVTADNDYYISNHLIIPEELEVAIMQEVITTGDSVIELSGDQKSEWQANVFVIDIAKSNQLKLVIKTKP